MYVSCAILSLNYVPEQFGVVLPIPATPHEVVTAIQEVRSQETAAHFPQLLSVLPQPTLGMATFVAQPSWPGGPCQICIDTTVIDGRIFVAAAPEYACKYDLLSLSGLLTNLDYDVFYNVDQEPINGQLVHLFPGALVTIIHAGALLPAQHDLAEMLQSRLAWGTSVRLPQLDLVDARCLLFGNEAHLCVDAMRAPQRYRDVIASTTWRGSTDHAIVCRRRASI